MASIQTGIELNDGLTSILNSIINSVNLAVSAMEDMQGVMNADIDTSSLAGARSEIDQATIAVNELEHAMSELTAPAVDTPQADAAGNQVINVNVDPVIPDPLIPDPQEIRPDVVPNAPPEPVDIPVEWQTDGLDLNTMADAANNELERLRAQLNQAVIEQNELNAAMDDMDVSAANDAYLRLNQSISGTEQHLRDNVDEQGRFDREIDQGVDSAGNLRSMIASAVGAFAGLAGIRKAISWIEDCTEAFDTQRNAELQLMTVLANRLDADYVSSFAVETEVTADTSEVVAEINSIQDQVDGVTVTATADTRALTAAFDTITAKASEIQSKGIYGDEVMIAGAAEFSTYFSDTKAIEMMMDTLADYAMGMSGGGEIDASAMVDYATGLGKVMSGSYDAMTKKGFEFTEAQKAVIEGTATQEQIVAAIGAEYLNMSQDVQAAAAINAVVAESWDGLYESMSNTPEGKIIQMTNAWGDMKEVIGGQLYPYVILFVDAITSHWGTIQKVLDVITQGLQLMMGVLSWLLEGALNFAQVVIDNWSWISPIIYGIVAALAVYGAYLAITKGLELASAAAAGAVAVGKGLLAAATMISTGATWAETTAQMGLNSAMYACPIVWIIMLIIALIAVIFAVCNAIAKLTGVADSGFGVICGGINVVDQFFKNLFMTIGDILLGIGNAIAALAGNMVTAFHNAIYSIQSKFYILLATALTVVAKICEALSKLPFLEFDFAGFSSDALSAADIYAAKAAEAAGSKEEYKSISDAFNEGFSTFDTFQSGWASDAFAAGAEWGDGIAEKVSDFSLTDLFATDQVPAVDDYISGLGDAMATNGTLGDIADNTGRIRDSLDCTEEDLKYLRDIAEQETVNRYTLAEVKIEQTNHNNINNSMDLDGVVSGLTDAVNEAVDSITEGVHE